MAGRVYLNAIVALVLVAAQASAFFIRPVPLLPNMLTPFVHPAALYQGGYLRGLSLAARTKPLSRPFTAGDIPGNGFINNGVGGGIIGGGFRDVDPIGAGDGIIGGGLGGVGGLTAGFGLAAANNDLNAIGLTGAMDPMDVRGGLEISDSSLALSGAGAGFQSGLLSPGTELTDSSVLVNSGGVGSYPAGSLVQTF